MENVSILNILIPIFFSPLLSGIINFVKAKFAGRKGQSIFQLYYDIFKLFRKTSVYSNTITKIFKITPVILISIVIALLFLLPSVGFKPVVEFEGSFILVFYLFALYRFFMIISALDTGSSFEGMGASREAFFSFFAEVSIFISIATLCLMSPSKLVSDIFSNYIWSYSISAGFIVFFSFFVVLLCENARVPFDDPNTHLELTMIHEVMILDNSGPDLGIIFYSASIKLWIFSSILANLIPLNSNIWYLNLVLFLMKILFISASVGFVESVFARVRLKNITDLLGGNIVFSLIGFIIIVIKNGFL